MGFDTDDGSGERSSWATSRSYVKPRLTCTRRSHRLLEPHDLPGPPEIFIVNWDGTGLRKLGRRVRDGAVAEPGRRQRLGVRRQRTTCKYDFKTRHAISDRRARRSANWCGTPRSSAWKVSRCRPTDGTPAGCFRGRRRASRTSRTKTVEEIRRGLLDVDDPGRAVRCSGTSTARTAT